MATIVLTIPDAQLPRVIDGISSYYGYSPNILSPQGGLITNPETKGQFAKRMLIEQTEIWVATVEAEVAKKTTYQTALDQLTIT